MAAIQPPPDEKVKPHLSNVESRRLCFRKSARGRKDTSIVISDPFLGKTANVANAANVANGAASQCSQWGQYSQWGQSSQWGQWNAFRNRVSKRPQFRSECRRV
jgi:hypothetical protein